MTVKTVSLGTPYRWLGEAFALCRGHSRVLFAASSLLMMVALLPSVLQLLIETATHPSAGAWATIQVVGFVVGLVLVPPMTGGFYRLVHALHEGRAARAFDLLAVFQDPTGARRLIVTNLMFVLVAVLLGVGLAFAFGGEALLEYLRTIASLQPGATQLPPLPAGLVPLLSVLLVLAMVIMTAQQLATAQVALSGCSPLVASGDGFKVAVRNIGALLLFYLPLAVIAFVLMMVFILVAVLLGWMLSVISPLLAAALVVPLALGFVLLLYAVMFTFFYHAWRDTLGPGTTLEPDHQIAV